MCIRDSPLSARWAKTADSIVTINNDGRLAVMGNFEQLRTQSGRLANLETSLQSQPHQQEQSTTGIIGQSEASKSDGSAAKLTQPITNFESDLTRQTGDSSLYKYYAVSAGSKSAIVFLIGMIFYTFCDAFPSKSTAGARYVGHHADALSTQISG